MVTRTLKPLNSEANGFLHFKLKNDLKIFELGSFTTIGRDPFSTIPLADDFVSLKHARIERRNSGFVLVDMQSRNGCFVNGTRVMEAVLVEGDRLRFGTTDFYFSHSRETASDKHLSSKSTAWDRALKRLPSIAVSDLPVLLSGPSGSGKEVLAEEIHRLSHRARGPFVSVNCSALSEALIESELFGHVKGSFTGASADRKGAFESARGGTLFLDEIGDLPLTLQPKLLRALENKQIRPVGSDHNVDTDVRIIAATHQSLKQKIAEASFRADLYFRLHVAEIVTPALVDRMEDFDDLLYSFAKSYRVGFSFAALQRLKEHSWPGNIRELKNVVARAKAYFPDRQVELEDLHLIVDIRQAPRQISGPSTRSLIREIELEMIRSRLIANRGNQRQTAADLGMPKSTLHDRIRSYGIDVAQLLRDAGLRG